MNEETTTIDPKTRLRNLYREYVGKEPAEDAKNSDLRAAIRAHPEYGPIFARTKDEGSALEEMTVRVIKNQEAPAWLIDGNYTREFQGKVKGRGAMFRLRSGKTHFVDYNGPLAGHDKLPILAEFVFPGVSIIRNTDDGTEDYDFRGAKPVAKKHGIEAPPSDLEKPIERCFKFSKKKGVVVGESFDQELAFVTVTMDKEAIRYYPPGDYSDRYRLSFPATDSKGLPVIVEADAEDMAAQLSLSVESPAALWKNKLAGQSIAANGQLSVFLRKGDKFFGDETGGFLAGIAEAQGSRIKAGKEGKRFLDLNDMHSEEVPHPYIIVGEAENKRAIYRLESYLKEGKEAWTAYVRADAELGTDGKPLPPTLNCVVKPSKAGKQAFNAGAWCRLLGMENGVTKASETSRQLLLD